MGIIDIVLSGLLGYGCYKGIKNGLFVELASLVSFVLGVYLAIKFSYVTQSFLEGMVDWSPKTIQVMSFVLTLIVVVVGIHLLAKIFTKIADFAFLGWVNKLAGAFFALLKTALLLGIVLSLFQKVNVNDMLVSKEKQENSLLFNPIMATADFVLPVVKNWFEDLNLTSNQ